MAGVDLERAAHAAEAAADRARQEILPRFRRVSVETKADGSPVTEADRAAERAIRKVLREATPGIGVIGEELGSDGDTEGLHWIVDPIDGTISFSRGIPLFTTLIALVEDGQPVVGLIDVPGVNERFVGFKGGGCRRNGSLVQVSSRSDPAQSLVAHGDLYCFEQAGQQAMFQRMARELPLLRGYTDGFGHAQVLGGGVDAMVDLMLNPWDAAPAQILIPEAGGSCETVEMPEGKVGLILGNPALVKTLLTYLNTA